MRLCHDVFAELHLESEYALDHLLREALRHYRSTLGIRQHHANPDEEQSALKKPRKRMLKPKPMKER